MRRTTIVDDEEALFDLPLGPAPARERRPERAAAETRRDAGEEEPGDRPAEPPAGGGAEPEPLPLFGEGRGREAGTDPGEPAAAPAAEEEAGSAPRPEERRVSILHRCAAGAIDLTLLGVALAVLIGGVALMGVPVRLGQAPAYGLVLALFSFLYHVLALAFWGQTPGMVHERLRARSRDGLPLTFGQAALRWLGAAATLLLLGLPTLLALLDGGSLADRVSGSEIVTAPRARN